MLHTEFQSAKPNGSEEGRFFKYFSMYFCDLNLGPLGVGPSWTLGPYLNKLGEGPLGNATYQISSI